MANIMSERPKRRTWDIPIRVFHWTLVGLVGLSIYTGLTGGLKEMDFHVKSGVVILSLVLFRLIWGVVGGTHARFTDFVKGPAQVVQHVQQEILAGKPSASAGHNPLGGWMVLALLMVLLALTGTGLFANDDIFTEGPLASKVSKAVSDRLTTFHHWAGYGLFALIGLHVCAVFSYLLLKKEDLITPMMTGNKVSNGEDATFGSPLLAAVIWGASLGVLWWLLLVK